ncbi:MAG: trypsin-like peptidase domain-containing protein [Sphaerospermopsis sp. SIO1G1]|nr:trypsin-like peptidase domain-containing protein [Sphaerospermopsis sp. SIO1G1]
MIDSEKSLLPQTIKTLAKSITVKVLLGDNWGSGIIIHRQGRTYTVLTNQHVLTAGNHYHIETADGKIYQANQLQDVSISKFDLGLLQFTSPVKYKIAPLSPKMPKVGNLIFASGYPIQDDPSQPEKFVFISGKVALIPTQAIQGGYQIGCTTAIAKGMSGGPLFNTQGEVVGINGMHQYPLWGNPYVFLDGTFASIREQKQMSKYSWSVPMGIFANIAPRFLPGTNTSRETAPPSSESLPSSTPNTPLPFPSSTEIPSVEIQIQPSSSELVL